MKAVVARGPHDYRLEEVETPIAGANEIVIKVSACGICASDMKAEHGAGMFWDGEDPWLKAPVIPGHEFFGTVEEIGKGAEEHFGVSLGDRVIAEQIVPCGSCRFCRSGKYWMCEVHNIYGFQKDVAEGGMAEYMKFQPTSIVHTIPEALSFEEAAIIEPMACSIHTVQRADIELDDVVVLAGAGPLGLGMVEIIRLKTPRKLVVLDMNDKRLEVAKKLGADVCFNPGKDDVLNAVMDMTAGYGCDVYIEATGNPAAVQQGMQLIRKLGRFVEFSVFGAEASLDWSVIGDRKELDVRGAHLGPYTYPIAIDLFERKLIRADDIVTHIFPLSDFDKALEAAGGMESIKTVLRMDGAT